MDTSWLLRLSSLSKLHIPGRDGPLYGSMLIATILLSFLFSIDSIVQFRPSYNCMKYVIFGNGDAATYHSVLGLCAVLVFNIATLFLYKYY